jgi:hypothetical protein
MVRTVPAPGGGDAGGGGAEFVVDPAGGGGGGAVPLLTIGGAMEMLPVPVLEVGELIGGLGATLMVDESEAPALVCWPKVGPTCPPLGVVEVERPLGAGPVPVPVGDDTSPVDDDDEQGQ